MLYLGQRYDSLVRELKIRGTRDGLDWADWESFVDGIPREFFKDYVPTKPAIDEIIGRISERLHQRDGWYRYYGYPLSASALVSILMNSKVQMSC